MLHQTYPGKEAAKQAVQGGAFSAATKQFAIAAIDGLVLPESWRAVAVHIAESDVGTLVHVHGMQPS